MFKCSYCDSPVDESDFNIHAQYHFAHTKEKDASGNDLPSKIQVNYLYVQDPE